MVLERKSASQQTLIICRIYSLMSLFLFVIGGLIFKFKESIKQRLSVINGEINTLRSDSQWHTPLALFYTALFIFIRYPLVLSGLPIVRLFLGEKSTGVLGMVAQYGGLLVVL